MHNVDETNIQATHDSTTARFMSTPLANPNATLEDANVSPMLDSKYFNRIASVAIYVSTKPLCFSITALYV